AGVFSQELHATTAAMWNSQPLAIRLLRQARERQLPNLRSQRFPRLPASGEPRLSRTSWSVLFVLKFQGAATPHERSNPVSRETHAGDSGERAFRSARVDLRGKI